MFESVESLKSKSIQLSLEAEKFKHENLELQLKLEAGGGGKGGVQLQGLEQKLYKLQEELTELHRKKGENSQQIIDLNNALQEKEKQLQATESRLSDAESHNQALRGAINNLEQSILDLQDSNQILKDEQQALQLAFSALEEKYRRVQNENAELVMRWMDQKAKDADKLNEENERTVRKRQDQLKKELADAAKEPVHINEGRLDFNFPIPCVTIPARAIHKIDAHDGEINDIRWTPSGRYFATGGADRKLKLWEVNSGKISSKGILSGSNAAVMCLEFDPDENLVLGASNDFASRVWTISDQRLRHTLTGHSGKVLAARFLDCATKVVSGSHDRTLKIWDLHSRACTKTIFAGSSCNDLVTADGGTTIISGHFDKRIRFWDTRSEHSTNEISLQGRVTSLDLSPDKQYLLSCSRDETIKLIDLRMNQTSGTLSADGFHVGCDWTRAAFSPDGEYVVCGSSDGSVFIWNARSGKIEKVLKEHSHSVMSVNWHPAGSMILSCDKQKKVVLWSDF
ncbi:autophagy-related protein 16-1-like [Tubulanus polymorphus]|uniref:autophagy-related protein 16-1-like n=1 Tax=Tubulanus polymorphus TaxID=672921 RepID=UPI003DA5E71D